MSDVLTHPHATLAIELAIDILLKATAVIAIAWLASWWLRRASAALRNAVWTLALGSLLLLPLLSVALPDWQLGAVHVALDFVGTTYPAHGPESPGLDVTDTAGATDAAATIAGDRPENPGLPPETPSVVPQTRSTATFSVIEIGLLVWYLGALLLLGRLGLDGLRIHRLTRSARHAPARLRDQTHRLAAEAGIRRPVRVVLSDAIKGPLTWGAWAPVVMLPEAATTWPAERTHVVLLHELAHIRRWDYPALVMSEVVCALYWLNPLVRLAAKRGAIERERACDDRALFTGVPSDVYATHLLEIARAQVEVDVPRAAFAIARPSSLSTRISMILARGLDRAPLSTGRVLSVAMTAVLLALPLASVDIWGTRQTDDPVEARVLQLQDDDPGVRRFAAWALGELESPRGVRPLVERLADPSADVRQVAAWALGEIKDTAAVEPLIGLLDDDDELVREMAVLSLGEIEHHAAVGPLTAALSRHAELREPVIWALGEIAGPAADRARESIFADWGRRPYENDEVWTGQLGGSQTPAPGDDVASLVSALRDEDRAARLSAAERLGWIGAEAAVDALLDALRDADPAVRAMAIWSLDETNPSRE